MTKYQRVMLAAGFVVLTLCVTSFSEANLITNGDFSNGLSGWSIANNAIATDYVNLPAGYKNTWDLSAWNSQMDGRFALFEGRGQLFTSTTPLPDTSFFSLSFDYAVAWEKSNILQKGLGYGYFYIQIDGKAQDNRIYPLTYKEIDWPNPPDSGVLSGSIFTENFIQRPGLTYKELLLSINVFNPSQLNQVVGVDNVNLSAAPIPEPATVLLVGSGLVGLAGLFRKKLKR